MLLTRYINLLVNPRCDMSFNQCVLLVAIPVAILILFALVIAWFGRPKNRQTKSKAKANPNNKLTQAQQDELKQIAFEMSCVFAGKNILQQFLVQISESLAEQEIITHLANSIKICNNNGEVEALDLTTSTTTDDYTEHARMFYETIIKHSKEKQGGNVKL